MCETVFVTITQAFFFRQVAFFKRIAIFLKLLHWGLHVTRGVLHVCNVQVTGELKDF